MFIGFFIYFLVVIFLIHSQVSINKSRSIPVIISMLIFALAQVHTKCPI